LPEADVHRFAVRQLRLLTALLKTALNVREWLFTIQGISGL
jgi:hypothetical protein